jgi:hypothetical protein
MSKANTQFQKEKKNGRRLKLEQRAYFPSIQRNYVKVKKEDKPEEKQQQLL